MGLPDRYAFRADPTFTSFEFISEGPRGKIIKLIQIEEIGGGTYNLAFGDKDVISGALIDSSRTDNGDTEKVLATVVAAIYLFTDANPEALVYAKGSSPSRTRLYQMGIASRLEEIESEFVLLGRLEDGSWTLFRRGNNYLAFLARRKRR